MYFRLKRRWPTTWTTRRPCGRCQRRVAAVDAAGHTAEFVSVRHALLPVRHPVVQPQVRLLDVQRQQAGHQLRAPRVARHGHERLRAQQRVGHHREPRGAQRQVLLVLPRAVPRLDVPPDAEAQDRLLHVHPGVTVRAALSADARHILGAARVAR